MQTIEQIKADAIVELVSNMIGALEAGFIDSPNCTLAEIHRAAQNHIKDRYGIDTPSLEEQWGTDVAIACGLDAKQKTL